MCCWMLRLGVLFRIGAIKNITLMKPCEKRNSLFYIRIE